MLVATYSFSEMKQVINGLEPMVPYAFETSDTYCGFLLVFETNLENQIQHDDGKIYDKNHLLLLIAQS